MTRSLLVQLTERSSASETFCVRLAEADLTTVNELARNYCSSEALESRPSAYVQMYFFLFWPCEQPAGGHLGTH